MIRISVENCMNAGPKFLFFFVRIVVLIVKYNFNPCGIF